MSDLLEINTASNIAANLGVLADSVPTQVAPQFSGRLTRMVGLTLEAVGCQSVVGDRCLIHSVSGDLIEAEVVGFEDDRTFLMPLVAADGLKPGALVTPADSIGEVAVGWGLLGRVLDGAGNVLDDHGPLEAETRIPFNGAVINPLARAPIRESLDVGIKAINSLLAVGVGQRIGLFAGSGVGKSMLLGMMTRFTTADIVVVGLIGERGREVKEFIEDILGEEGLKRAVVIASPADDSPLMRLRAAMLTTRIAEYFRDQGKNVLLLMDSLTRYAQAQREIALSVGEPPATKGYPPSVFAKLPQLVERAGNGKKGGGSITAFYTVLTEGDDQQDPIADAARAILDGHIVLSRSLAEEGHYPAIDVEASISRVMPHIISAEHLQNAQRFKQIYARYQQARDLISVGAYVKGSDPQTDFAIERIEKMKQFLRQGLTEESEAPRAIAEMSQTIAAAAQAQ
ncbi:MULTISPECIES: flagellar protein export ATPase FliI [unclassified Oleiphilus]|jgi:flagellum-specific ATP synthase|uniref:flagellar protein export ATPase FliI n=1 Tax=unclassified Oleiphilus TaxID=2631174 RepID=UPI0007C239E6|nr:MULTISPECIES: flagellar protein export ATPase FliI [unclassified Oleiphilus]KZY47151.1 EscN/YscN/HrcN family type III secretion system ATPase [Oleiphilus sp. HI0050]KZY79033.1 EscN/YscN/HrcN family type III secretion system ATPase [Oleiphilus sp. HI0068]KZY85841.1 EscN/YscN/HrcN family type III secretion system ATPase [Oleiphilus sp. HI0069]KZY92921.1 EscN/YscN/HrcN family type III secretion system ATPase [Oleiphilus sp. HI0072]KZZ19382.1 EscN/YscN/HrcN family type III secretion system ATPa